MEWVRNNVAATVDHEFSILIKLLHFYPQVTMELRKPRSRHRALTEHQTRRQIVSRYRTSLSDSAIFPVYINLFGMQTFNFQHFFGHRGVL